MPAMKRFRAILAEIYSLFVDDGAFAAAILGWLGVLRILAGHGWVAGYLKGPLMFAGLALLLVASAARRTWSGR